MTMNKKLFIVGAILLSTMGAVSTADASGIPSWIKDSAGWYSQDRITDEEFVKTLQFLIDEGILEVPQVPQVQATETDLSAVWEAINFNAEEIRSTVKFSPTEDLYNRFNQIENHLVDIEDGVHDNTVKLQSERTVAEHTHIDYEQKYNQLMEMYQQLGERVVDLEKKEIERTKAEIARGVN